MRLDDDLRLAILEKVGIYAERFSVPEPSLLLTTREVLALPREVTSGCRTSAYRYYGVTYFQHNYVFLNVRKIPDERALEGTIVHEMVHVRFPYLPHGRRFRGLVRRGLRGGRFPPYRMRGRARARGAAAP